MIKKTAYMKGIVRNGGKGRFGVGLELFRLEATESELTELEQEAIDSSPEEDQSTTAIMRIYEDIGEDFWTGGGITVKGFAEDLDKLGTIKRLNVHINSLGGDCHVAQAIHSILDDYECQKKTSYIDGICASAATLIACGADEVVARHNTNYMIHYPWTIEVGNADAMRKAATDLDKITVPIVSVYKNQVNGKITEEDIRQLMKDETWMTADEALEYGFVDIVRGKINAIARIDKSTILCADKIMNLGKYHYMNVPNFHLKKNKKENKMASSNVGINDPGHSHTMLDPEHSPPVLTPELRISIITSERKRLADLDAMMAPGLETIIASAKTDGRLPSDIAMECFNITKDRVISLGQLNALHKDGASAAGIPAGDAPLSKPESKRDKGIKMLTNAQTSLGKRFQLTNNGGKK